MASSRRNDPLLIRLAGTVALLQLLSLAFQALVFLRTDLYAAGMVLHECLTGATPFQRDTPRGFLARKLETPPRPSVARAPRDPRTLEGAVAWMIAVDAGDRPTSATEVAAALAGVS